MQNKIISKKLCVPPRITAKVWLQSIEMRLLQKSLFIHFPFLSSSQNGNGTTVLSDHSSFVLQL
ncbi:hypothetical protein Bca52824_083497 [Brassica carinata]|uniref:Uncharacterized protein n=1 Tax=Brassica carinata TaxID=52824 RepID=A0A8X7PKA6_BRACI|nr:hypothetical protein Bca52824_083497 [Brassica carinata]